MTLKDLWAALQDFYNSLEEVTAAAEDSFPNSDDAPRPCKRQKIRRKGELEIVYLTSEAGACLRLAIHAPEFFKYAAVMYPKKIRSIFARANEFEKLENVFLDHPHYFGFDDVSVNTIKKKIFYLYLAQ